MSSTNLNQLVNYIQTFLQTDKYADYCPNGLQVQGSLVVEKIVSGVTASMSLLEAAAAAEAQVVLVHHGFFWKNENPCITGIKQKRIKFLLDNNINLLAYHLPLDAHPEVGNNAQLAKVLGMTLEGWSGQQNMIAHGHLINALPLAELAELVRQRLNREPLVFGEQDKIIKKVAWCTGAAQSYMEEAISLGVDLFISGEVSEQTYHLAQESGVAYIAAGHHATERYGVMALGEHLAEKFKIKHAFVDINNPV